MRLRFWICFIHVYFMDAVIFSVWLHYCSRSLISYLVVTIVNYTIFKWKPKNLPFPSYMPLRSPLSRDGYVWEWYNAGPRFLEYFTRITFLGATKLLGKRWRWFISSEVAPLRLSFGTPHSPPSNVVGRQATSHVSLIWVQNLYTSNTLHSFVFRIQTNMSRLFI